MCSSDIPRRYGVYPRACGGTAGMSGPPRRATGLSPRVRGNPSRAGVGHHHKGSIPARAGEPCNCAASSSLVKGLSPRVRGNRAVAAPRGHRRRSIPARAGEPGAAFGLLRLFGVYPRACGGTARNFRSASLVTGLSPRVRGNRQKLEDRYPYEGSIPARAGEPVGCEGMPCAGPVYPRACGGTPWQIDIPYPQSLAKGR